MNQVLIDTNAYSKLLSGNKNVLNSLRSFSRVYVSVIVIGELFTGFRGGTKFKKNKNLLSQFLSRPKVEVINITKDTAEVFGTLKSGLKNSGTPLPINDIWIAAQAIETGSVVLTYDKHFNIIPGIRLWEDLD